jgi:hypothetical protein
MLLDDPLPDTIPLTAQEKVRFTELEAIVETHLETFLSVGRALAEIRNRRLYRELYGTWEDYCTRKWGFGYSRANELIRSTEIAEGLLAGPAAPDGDAPLPADLSPAALRPLQRLEPALANSCWRLACRVGKPTSYTVGKIVRAVEQAVSQGTNGSGSAKSTPPPSEKKVFLVSLHRLAESRVPACVIIQGVDESAARAHLRACQVLICRLHEIVHEIKQQFPSL